VEEYIPWARTGYNGILREFPGNLMRLGVIYWPVIVAVSDVLNLF
jgi:hypothetical protein